ncbi:uncharacterized protein LOC143293435 [Babylonia areolata]|uniref:uncharacterized protein LOC143293435 n=1 Tax=Babylonia areolata TaxID=304850 RepID=UPI003FCF999E
MGPLLKGSLGTLAVMILSEIAYKCYLYLSRGSARSKTENESKDNSEIMEVFFFPDKEVACRTHFLSETRCFKTNCQFSHGKTSLSELYRHLSSCRKTMDVCVFVLTCVDLASIVLTMHRRGVKVRVITDDDQENISGSQVWSLRKAGIIVRTDRSSYFMHHKFVLVDGQLLINGSFNWTRNAITGNQENVFVTNHSKIVCAYQNEFEKLWEQFDPKNTLSNSDFSKVKRSEKERGDS